ncbi:hypothetical protein TNCV_4139481 [Trichonephila clavipes]|nr:hypothetical protein TNCV_4139481 [Trichonephila clavipes]
MCSEEGWNNSVMHRFKKLECPYRTRCISNAEYDGVESLRREEKIHYCTRYVERILVYTNGRQQQTSNSHPNSLRTVPMECVTIWV